MKSAAPQTYAVEDAQGYNCWPMLQAVGNRLVCVYTIGKEHDPGEKGRAAFSRFSDDGGVSWSDRKPLFRDLRCGTSSIGKGLDDGGAALFWIRRLGIEPRMALYRTADGVDFELLSTPALSPNAMQVTDIFKIPDGLMCLWFSDDYSRSKANKSWGTLTSRDNGVTWEQRVIEDGLGYPDWPTEPSVAVLGDGRLLCIARCEGGTGAQFQLTSSDWGMSWSRSRTNIADVQESTPSLVFDPETGIVRNYYYQRGAGLLKCRTAVAESVFAKPLSWPDPVVVAYGGTDRPYDSGNANALRFGNEDIVVYYTGDAVNCSVVATACRPEIVFGLNPRLREKEVARSSGNSSDLVLRRKPGISFDCEKRISIEGLSLEKPVKLFIVSDTHLGFHDERDDRYADFYKRMAQWPAAGDSFLKVLEAAKAGRSDALLLLGDIISFPTLANVDFVNEALEKSGLDYLFTAGNHDWHFEGDAGSDLEQRARWIEWRLKCFYGGRDPLMQSRVINGLRIVMIDNSAYHVTPGQLAFWKSEVAMGDPVILSMHIPFWVPGYAMTTCGSPGWGAANDELWKIERRERWAEKLMPSTIEFRDSVYSTENLVAIFAGHEHKMMLSEESGHLQVVVPWNRHGAYLEVSVC